MIEIDEVGAAGYRYRFPTIDFKFQNTGNATAFLWKFEINILRAEVDLVPILNFQASVSKKDLEISVLNDGWGAVRDLDLIIKEEKLNRIFPDSARRFRGNIKSRGSQRLIRLTHKDIEPERYNSLSKNFTNLIEEIGEYYPSDRANSPEKDPMILGAITCTWKSKDEKGKEYTGKDWASPQDYDSIALTEGGFIGIPRVPLHIHACLMNSDTTYVTIIEPAKGPHEVTYPISRRIAPGDVERFHIMVGASKSSKLRLQFKFYVDKDHIVQSEMFDVDVWNPKNSGWEKYYEDNSALSREKIDREIDRLKKEAQGGKIDYWLLKRKAQLSAIPFLTKKKDGW